jgi:hypothetical protein
MVQYTFSWVVLGFGFIVFNVYQVEYSLVEGRGYQKLLETVLPSFRPVAVCVCVCVCLQLSNHLKKEKVKLT